MNLYCLENSRTDEQRQEMLRLEADGICIFCPQHLEQDRQQGILRRTNHWTVTPNEYPYQETKLHLLLVPDEHVADLIDLSAEAQREFWQVLEWIRDHYSLTYYGLGSRNGDCRYTGGTIYHVHVHVLVGDVENPDHTGVKMKLTSRPNH